MLDVKTQYRPDLDGLRAVAVWLVVLFHAGFEFIPGGFIGVDVFFVLSGFLITGLLLKGMQKNEFSYQQFYLRRIRRLIPAYLTVAFFSFIPAYFFLIPSDFIHHGRMLGLALISLSNFYIANTTAGYFDQGVESIPMLHTWSLAVEEQFYLLWPMTLMFLLKWVSIKKLQPILLFLTFLFVLFSHWYSISDPVRAYYLLPARVFELMMGACISVYLARLPDINKFLVNVLAVSGLCLIIFPALLFSKNIVFPGLNAFWPCFGAVILIYTGRYPTIISKIFESRFMVWQGKTSYSLYLWHWVVFTFVRYLTGELTLVLQLFCIGFSVFASHVTWQYVENRFRFESTWPLKRTFITFFALPLGLFVMLSVLIDENNGMVNRFKEHKLAIQALDMKPVDLGENCLHEPANGKLCDILLIGDSHAWHMADFFKVMADESNLKILTAMGANCQPFSGVELVKVRPDKKIETTYPHCETLKNQHLENLAGYDYVILGGYWALSLIKEGNFYYRKQEGDTLSIENNKVLIKSGLEQTINKILEAGAVPVLLHDIPSLTKPQFKCALRELITPFEVNCNLPISIVSKQQAFVDEIIVELGEKYPQLKIINPRNLFCNDQHCEMTIDGLPIYMDDDHLNGMASQKLGKLYIERYGNLFHEN